jgi:NTE family protein
MPMMPNPTRAAPPAHEHTVLVLQGGGALGAYQAGAFEGFAEAGAMPDWVAGVSIGAINAALIAGNPPQRRVQRLREFWQRVSVKLPLFFPSAKSDPLRAVSNRAAAVSAMAFGIPGFFRPRLPALVPFSLGVYDTDPLRATLLELVDFDLVNSAKVRLSVGAVNVCSGNSVYFDNTKTTITPARCRRASRRSASTGRSTGTAASSATRRCGTCSTIHRRSTR